MLGKLLLLILLLLCALENSISLSIMPFQRRMNPSNWATFEFHFFTPPGQWFSALLIVYPPFPGTGIPGGHCRAKHLGLVIALRPLRLAGVLVERWSRACPFGFWKQIRNLGTEGSHVHGATAVVPGVEIVSTEDQRIKIHHNSVTINYSNSHKVCEW